MVHRSTPSTKMVGTNSLDPAAHGNSYTHHFNCLVWLPGCVRCIYYVCKLYVCFHSRPLRNQGKSMIRIEYSKKNLRVDMGYFYKEDPSVASWETCFDVKNIELVEEVVSGRAERSAPKTKQNKLNRG